MDFICHSIQGGTLSLQDYSIQKIKDDTRPISNESFLGLMGFYLAYIPNHEIVAWPLTDLARKEQSNKVKWYEPQE